MRSGCIEITRLLYTNSPSSKQALLIWKLRVPFGNVEVAHPRRPKNDFFLLVHPSQCTQICTTIFYMGTRRWLNFYVNNPNPTTIPYAHIEMQILCITLLNRGDISLTNLGRF